MLLIQASEYELVQGLVLTLASTGFSPCPLEVQNTAINVGELKEYHEENRGNGRDSERGLLIMQQDQHCTPPPSFPMDTQSTASSQIRMGSSPSDVDFLEETEKPKSFEETFPATVCIPLKSHDY